MKKLSNYINDALNYSRSEHINEWKLNDQSSNNVNKYTVTANDEYDLQKIINRRINLNEKAPYLLDIDVSNVTTFKWLFSDCPVKEKITIIDISSWNISDLLLFQGTFSELVNLKTVIMPKINPKKLTSTLGMFYGCTSLTEVKNIENWTLENVNNMGGMFNKCSNLISLDVSKWNVSKVKNLNSVFNECVNLTSLNGVEDWNINSKADMPHMFYSCKETIIPSWYDKYWDTVDPLK